MTKKKMHGNENGAQNAGQVSSEDAALTDRLSKLDNELHKKRDAIQEMDASGQETTSAMGPAMAFALRLSFEFVGSVLVGGFIGWGGSIIFSPRRLGE